MDFSGITDLFTGGGAQQTRQTTGGLNQTKKQDSAAEIKRLRAALADKYGGSGGDGKVLTPAQAAYARNRELEAGQARWRNTIGKDPTIQDILARRKDLSQGLNAQELNAQRAIVAGTANGQAQGAIRSLYANQARSGVRGGMAAAQQSRLSRQLASDRAATEQKMLLDNAAIQRQGLNDYQDFATRLKFGELGQGIGEASLGVADRTGYQQYLIGNAMANSAKNQPQSTIWSFFGL